jgi:dephospho-CoA kinase
VRVVGLTGGIGSGKTTVARMFEKLGAEIVDADTIAREVVRSGTPALAKITERFGADVLTAEGALDRKKLAAIVFSDDRARADLNAIVHPAVAQRTQEEILARAAKGARLILYDVPLLYESGLEATFPEVIVVSVPQDVQRARILARDALSTEDIEARIRAQMPLEAKVQRATWVIDNSGPLEETERRVKALFDDLIAQ